MKAILVIPVLLILIAAVILAFEIWMFVHAIQNQRLTPEARVLWVVGMLLLHPFVAIAYYFVEYKKA